MTNSAGRRTREAGEGETLQIFMSNLLYAFGNQQQNNKYDEIRREDEERARRQTEERFKRQQEPRK